jgi:hypothetical protein
MVRRSITLCLILFFIGLADAAIYKWIDKEGNVHYGEFPPPECEAQEVSPLPGPTIEETERAQERLKKLREQQRRRAEIRRQAKEVERQKKEEEKQNRIYRKKRCIMAWQNLHVLELKRPVYHINEDGERVYLDDETRSAEINRLREEIEKYCD